MPKPDAPRIAVIGAGPVGLEAALVGRKLGLPVTVYERGRVGEHILKWGHVRLFSSFGMNSTPLGRGVLQQEKPDATLPDEQELLTGHEYVAKYLLPLAQSSPIKDCLKTEAHVVAVGRAGLLKTEFPGDAARRGREPFRLLLRDAKGYEQYATADVVLDCTGTYGMPRWLGEGGLPAAGELAAAGQIAYGLEDILGAHRQKYAGKTVLLVGAGYTAATHACLLAELAEENPETWTVWLARGPRSSPLPRHPDDPLRERDRLGARANMLATRGEGNIEFHHSSVVERLTSRGPDQGFQVSARVAGKPRLWDVDRVIASVGYSPDRTIYQELQVHECYATFGPMALAAGLLNQPADDCLAISAAGADSLKTTEPNFFILGAKSYGRNSQFLVKTGFEQVRDAYAIITGKPVSV